MSYKIVYRCPFAMRGCASEHRSFDEQLRLFQRALQNPQPTLTLLRLEANG